MAGQELAYLEEQANLSAGDRKHQGPGGESNIVIRCDK